VTSTPAGLDCGATCTFAPHAGTVILTATAAPGWQFDGWGGACTGTTRETSVVMDADQACAARFSRIPGLFFLTMVVEGQGSVTSDPAGIACPSTCVALFSAGTTVDLTAQATSMSTVSLWLDDCPAPGILTNQIVMDTDKQCRIRFVAQAAFPLAQFTILPGGVSVGQVVTVDGNASCVFDPASLTCDLAGIRRFTWDFENDGTAEASDGRAAAAVAQYAFQSSGDHPVRLQVEGGPFFAQADTVEVISVQEAAGALFGLTVTKAGAGAGLIATDPPGLIGCGPGCPGTGPVLLEAGTVVTLVARPLDGASFTGWSGSCAGTAASTQVTMDGARTCTAMFLRHQFSLTVNNGGNGQVASNPPGIDCGADCSETYDGGIVVALTATPDPGFQVDAWTGCDAVSGNQCTVAMGADRLVGVTFSPTPSQFTLTVVINQPPGALGHVIAMQPPTSAINCGGIGTVCTEAFAPGTTVVLRPDDTSIELGRFSNWLGCDVVGELFACTVNMTSNRTVTAMFR
jgi:uncharacterized repeat protein (TIGR02543 family)